MKKKNKKGCATGGELDQTLGYASAGLQVAGAINPALAPLAVIPGLIQQYAAQQRQNATVVSATPGNYASGGVTKPVPIGVGDSLVRPKTKRNKKGVPFLEFGLPALGALAALGVAGVALDSNQSVSSAAPMSDLAMPGTMNNSFGSGQGTPDWTVVYDPMQQKQQMTYAATGGPIDSTLYRPVLTDPKLTMMTPSIEEHPLVKLMRAQEQATPTRFNPSGELTSSKSKLNDRFRERAYGGPTEPLQFLGRSYKQAPETWTVPKHQSAGLHDVKMNVIPENTLNLKGIRTQATDKTPYMHINDNIYYNPYDSVYTARQKDGSYKEIPETATVDGNQDAKIRNYSAKIINNPYFDVAESYRLRGNGKGDAIPRHLEKFPNKAMGGELKGYATGGQIDNQLSDSSFQVQGNPNVTDGNYYPEYNANLDHGEVVKDKFVFSEKLKDPNTNKSFAKLAKVIESSTGKAEKALKINPHDSIASNTIKHNETSVAALAKNQEALATMMGLRNKETMGYAAGGNMGPGDPVYMEVPSFGMGLTKTYFDPKTNMFFTRNPLTGGYSEAPFDATWFNANKAQIEAHAAKYGQNTAAPTPTPVPVSASTSLLPGNAPGPSNWNTNTTSTAKSYPKKSTVSNTKTPQGLPNGPVNPNYKGDPYLDMLIQGNYSKYSVDPLQPLNMLNRNTEYDDPNNPGTTVTGPSDIPQQVVSQRTIPTPTPPKIDTTTNLTTTPAVTAGGNPNAWATGDYLQAAKVLSGFGQLVGGYKKEKPNYDNTQITQSVYDPRQALQANQRTYKDALAGYDAPSINTGRAFANAMYANKLGQNDQVISQYQQMNQQAKQQYETRASEQRRYNVGQTSYTADINQHNSDAYRMAVDSAFTGLSNFGVGLNEKKQATTALEILKKMHPEVYANVMGLTKTQ